MKKTVLFIVMFLSAISVFAQDGGSEIKTLFGNNGNRSNGGYGGVSTAYSRIGGRDAILIGGRGAWLVNHSFGLGLAGSGFLTEYKMDTELQGEYQLAGGYGGLMFEFIAMPKSPVHLSFPIVVGAGGVSYVKRGFVHTPDNSPYNQDSNAFFVVEPGVELEVNVIKIMRVAFGVSYRYTSNIDLEYFDSQQSIVDADVLRGFSGGITFKFGKF